MNYKLNGVETKTGRALTIKATVGNDGAVSILVCTKSNIANTFRILHKEKGKFTHASRGKGKGECEGEGEGEVQQANGENVTPLRRVHTPTVGRVRAVTKNRERPITLRLDGLSRRMMNNAIERIKKNAPCNNAVVPSESAHNAVVYNAVVYNANVKSQTIADLPEDVSELRTDLINHLKRMWRG